MRYTIDRRVVHDERHGRQATVALGSLGGKSGTNLLLLPPKRIRYDVPAARDALNS